MNVFAKWTAVAGLVLAVASSLTCSVDPVTFSVEDCGAPGDENGNGTADCVDPACVDTPSCPAVCGNVFVELGEACDDGNRVDGDGCEANCTLPRCGNAIVDQGEACDDGNVVIGDGCDASCVASSQVYVKASNTGAGDNFGIHVALSADGTTMAVGSTEASKATGINGDQADNTMPSAGAVYIFVRTGATWSQQAYVKARTRESTSSALRSRCPPMARPWRWAPNTSAAPLPGSTAIRTTTLFSGLAPPMCSPAAA